MKPILFKGSAVALVTLYEAGFLHSLGTTGAAAGFPNKNGTDAIVAVGTTGESATLTDEEHTAVIRFVWKRSRGGFL